MRTWLGVVVLVAGLLGGAACGLEEPEEGSSCSSGGRCADSASALICENGTFNRFPCRGPLGCQTSNDQYVCDMTVSRAGDPCTLVHEGFGSCMPDDPNHMALCKNGTFEIIPCDGCVIEGDRLMCQR